MPHCEINGIKYFGLVSDDLGRVNCYFYVDTFKAILDKTKLILPVAHALVIDLLLTKCTIVSCFGQKCHDKCQYEWQCIQEKSK